ncbi:MAG: hypothetical protein ACPGYV_15095, partial [Phycisphaeraceae bacterium]
MTHPATKPARLPDLESLIERHVRRESPRQARRWRYYRNATASHDGGSAPSQIEGLPARLRPTPGRDREIVIENDIAWRVHTLVDFMFGKPIEIVSHASDPERAVLLRRFLSAVFEMSGGINLLQDAAVLGTVFGHVDLMLRVRGGGPFNLADPVDAASRFVIEPV